MDFMKMAFAVLGLGVGIFMARKGEAIFAGYVDPYIPESLKSYNPGLFLFGIILYAFGGKLHPAIPNLGIVLMGVGVADLLDSRYGGEQ